MRYPTVLLDLDHTLLDWDASADAAFDETLRLAGVPDPRQHQPVFTKLNKVMWDRVERGELSPNDVRWMRFEELIEVAAIDADPHAMADNYVSGLGRHGDLYPGAREVLETLAEAATLGLVTNGIGEVQRVRIERLGLDDYFAAVTISGEVGVAKPSPAIFDITFRALGDPDRTGALMVGDSLSSDIQGGVNAGIHTCWYAPTSSATAEHATHTIRQLAELPALVRRGSEDPGWV